MKKIISTLLFFACALSCFAQTDPLNVTYKGNVTYDEGVTDVWGYVAPGGTEYALVGAVGGVSIVDVSDPENPVEVFYVEGVESGWRDIKTWGDYAYVTNETANGLMVIDLSDLPNSINSFNWTPNIPGLGVLSTCHNIYIDEFGYAYLAGCNLNVGGVIFVDVFSTPGTPVYAGNGPAIYSHDVYARNNKMYSSEIYAGHFAIYDVSDKANPQLLGTQNTLYNFTHNTWLSDDGTILYTTDELAGATIGSFDVSDPSDIQPLDNFRPYETLGDGVTPHNVHVWEDWLIISYYSDGCIIVDGSRPENLVEVGNFDTYIPTSTGFVGAWGAYPFLPSGLILISDMGNGLYVLEPNYVNACWLEGQITDAQTSSPLNDASVEILTTNVYELSEPNGFYKTGFAVAGIYDVLVKKPGYHPTTVQAELENGEVTILNVELVPLVPFAVSGQVIEEGGGIPVANAKVSIINDDFIYAVETDGDGNFTIATFFEGDYEIFAGKWGYKTTGITSQTIDENNPSFTLVISPGYEDIFSLDLGWTIEHNALSGIWDRAEPIGVFLAGPNIYITPPQDVMQDIGNHCYVTGNTSDLQSGLLAVGDTKLISPEFDLTGYEEPYMSYYTWFLNVNPNNGNPGNNDLYVKLDNGMETVYVDTIGFDMFAEITWEYTQINIAEFIEPTSTMTVSFEASTPLDFSEVSEIGVDFFQVWDDASTGVVQLTDNTKIIVNPNPSSLNFVVNYDLESQPDYSRLLIYNTLGQLVESKLLTEKTGQVTIGETLQNGIYFAHIKNGNSVSRVLKLIKQ